MIGILLMGSVGATKLGIHQLGGFFFRDGLQISYTIIYLFFNVFLLKILEWKVYIFWNCATIILVVTIIDTGRFSSRLQ